MNYEHLSQMKKYLFLFAFLLPLSVAATYIFKTLDSSDGLASSQINCILKDNKGYMWFGTPAGLFRYDGYTFRNFQSNSQDGSSLPDSYIKGVQEAIDGSLWVETANGICIYHSQTETFERDMHQVYAKLGISDHPTLTFIDSYKNYWFYIPSKGIVAINMQQQLTYEFGYTDDVQGIPEGKVCAIGECRDGAVIVYSNGIIVCCDIMHQPKVIWRNDALAKQGVIKQATLKIFADQMDNLWLYGQGTLLRYIKKAGIWDNTLGTQLQYNGTNLDRSINGMAGDRNGNIWIATDHDGLIKVNVNTLAYEYVQPKNPNKINRLGDITSCHSVYVDNTDLLWVGTEKNGLAYYGENIYRFTSILNGDITAITEDNDGNIWYGTGDQGVIGYDGPLSGQKVTAMECTPDGSIWIGTKQNGITRILQGKSFFYSATKDSTRTLIDNHVTALTKDKVGNLWIGTSGGLQVYNPKMNTFSTYTKENGRLHTNNITSLHYSKNNSLLVGTNEGLLIFNLSSMEKTILTGTPSNMKSFTNNYITAVFEDSRGLIWLGTREGVNILNMEDDDLNFLSEKDGLCNNNIVGITEDNKHNVWIATGNGISRVVVQRNHEEGSFNYGLYNYDTSDGLQSNEFNPKAIICTAKGEIGFGGLYGASWVRRAGKNEGSSLPRVMLTQLFIDGNEIKVGQLYDEMLILPQALNESKSIELSNTQNSFTIKFGAGNYNQSERLQFMYWMEGKDDDWKNGNALIHGVSFNNLSFGTYILHVKAINAEGAVSNQERTLEITILPPWWISWWMILIYTVTAISLVYVMRIGRKRQQYIWQKKKAVINELMLQKEEIKAAGDELRQPMARMASIIGNLSEQETTIEGREQLNALHFQMLQIITRISEMQMTLENPENKAKNIADKRLLLSDNATKDITEITDGELTSEIKPRRLDLATKKYVITVVDNNPQFLKFIEKQLGDIYTLHTYNDIRLFLKDMDVLQNDIIICKQDMPYMTGSELCNKVKTSDNVHSAKFVLMTDGVLTPQDMQGMNITLGADDYIAKPFNIQEAAMRLNKLLGLNPQESINNIIEGGETRLLEGRNASMTTATETTDLTEEGTLNDVGEEVLNRIKAEKEEAEKQQEGVDTSANLAIYDEGETLNDYSMNETMDQQLLRNIEQYVLHNMSRGNISLEDLANAMGMGRVPFFHKIKSLTAKTPAELIREMRLKHACILLERTNINMSELAINTGFQTAENFIHIFKEKYGISPLEYRTTRKQK